MKFDDVMAELLSRYGTKANMARVLNTSRQNIQTWEEHGRVPYKFAIQLERLTNGEIKAVDIVDIEK